jgi:hypothetical protein
MGIQVKYVRSGESRFSLTPAAHVVIVSGFIDRSPNSWTKTGLEARVEAPTEAYSATRTARAKSF